MNATRWWCVALVALLAFQTLLAVDWLARDQRPAFWDPSAHGRETIKAAHALSRSTPPVRGRILPSRLRDVAVEHPVLARGLAGPVAGLANISEAFYRHSAYPSLSHFVGGLLAIFVGTSPDALAFALGTFWYAAMIVGSYFLGREVQDRACGLLAAVLVSSQPMQLTLARDAMVDSSMVAATVWGFWALARCDGFRRRRASVALGMLCGLGMLAKQPFVVVMGPPVAWLAVRSWLDHAGKRDLAPARRANMAAALLAALLVAGPWYAAYLPSMLSDPIRLGRVGAEVNRGALAASWANLTLYPKMLWADGLGPLLALPAALGLVSLAFHPRARQRAPIAIGLGAAFLFFTLVFPTKHLRYVAQIGPLLAVVTATGVAWLPSRSFRAAASLLLVAIAAVTVWGNTLLTGFGPLPLLQSNLTRPPDLRDWGEARVLAAVRDHAQRQPANQRVRLLVIQEGIDYWTPLMVRTLPATLALRDGLPVEAVETLDHLRRIPANEPFYFVAALQRPLGSHPGYIVWMEEGDRELLESRHDFELLTTLELPDQVRAQLFFHPGLAGRNP